MKFRKARLTLSLFLFLAFSGGCLPSSAAPVPVQNEANVTAAERKEIQAVARRFVSRMLEMRDVAPLVSEFFLDDFTSFYRQDFFEKVSPQLYATLTNEERARLFIAQENLCYFITLDVMTRPGSVDKSRTAFATILPEEIARKLNASRLVEGSAEFTDREELMKELAELEKAVVEARAVLSGNNLEQSPEFQKRLGRYESDSNLGYRVRASVIEEDESATASVEKEVERDERFSAGRKIFRVETPLFIGIILIRDGEGYKILALEPADGD